MGSDGSRASIIGCVYAWSTLTDQSTFLLKDPVKSYYIPKILFFYWMSSKGGSSMIYHNVISRVLKGSIQSYTTTSDKVEMNTQMMEEEVDDSILESVQESENDESTFSDHDLDSSSSDKETLENAETDSIAVSKTFSNQVNFTMLNVTGTLDQAPEAAE